MTAASGRRRTRQQRREPQRESGHAPVLRHGRDPANRNRVFGGQQDNGTICRSDVGGTSWDFFSGNDGFECAINAQNPSIAYGTIQSGEVVRTSDADAVSIITSNVTPRYDSG